MGNPLNFLHKSIKQNIQQKSLTSTISGLTTVIAFILISNRAFCSEKHWKISWHATDKTFQENWAQVKTYGRNPQLVIIQLYQCVSNNCSSCFTGNNINLGSWIFSASVSESVHWGHFSIVQVRVLGFLMTTKETWFPIHVKIQGQEYRASYKNLYN